MYITQTYLGLVARGAKAYVYFLSNQDASQNQKDLHDVFLNRAAEFGLSTGGDVAVLLPAPGFENAATRDLFDRPESPIQNFYERNIEDKLPGLLITRTPIDTGNSIGSAVFISVGENPEAFVLVKELVSKIISEPSGGKLIRVLKKINKFIYLRPNLMGLGVDINAVINEAIQKIEEK